MKAAAVIVAAGSGLRFGDAGKSFALTAGVPMAWWSLQAALESESVSEIVLVCGPHSRAAAQALLTLFESTTPITLAIGGARRQDSALAGIEATSSEVDIVAIHDAARPLVRPELFDTTVTAARATGAAVTGVPVSDTIKRVAGDLVLETVPRASLVAVQTPQAFDKQLLLNAFARAAEFGATVTDESALIEQHGHPVQVVPGRSDNIKVTYPSDLIVAEALLGARLP